jgi:large subunit ribosomal protein L17
MRHKKAGKALSRTWEHRKAMFRNMARSLLTHERIRTTETKAKELRKVSDRLISFGLEDSLHARRKAYKVLENHQLVQKLFDEIAPRFSGVPGGYTRVVKLGAPRRGDAAPMAMVELSREAATGKQSGASEQQASSD